MEEGSAKVRDEEADGEWGHEELDEPLGEDPAEVLFKPSTLDPFCKEDLASSETEEEAKRNSRKRK